MLRRLLRQVLVGERRRHRRLPGAALRLHIGGRPCQVRDWSPGGLCIEDWGAVVRPGETLEGRLTLGTGATGEILAEVVSVGADGAVRVRLLEITPALLLAMVGLEPR